MTTSPDGEIAMIRSITHWTITRSRADRRSLVAGCLLACTITACAHGIETSLEGDIDVGTTGGVAGGVGAGGAPTDVTVGAGGKPSGTSTGGTSGTGGETSTGVGGAGGTATTAATTGAGGAPATTTSTTASGPGGTGGTSAGAGGDGGSAGAGVGGNGGASGGSGGTSGGSAGSGGGVVGMDAGRDAGPLMSIDDSVTGTGLDQFNYVGAWSHCNPCTTASTPPLYMGTNSWAGGGDAGAGDYVTFRFSGTEIVLHGVRDPRNGRGAVSIDNGAETTVDFYATARAGDQTIWSSSVLPSGTHTLKLRATGTKNASSMGTTVVVDRVEFR
jgi:hypothetical protein